MYVHMNIWIKKKICLPYRYCFCPSYHLRTYTVTYLSLCYSAQHSYWSRNSLTFKWLVAAACAHGIHHLTMFLIILNTGMAFWKFKELSTNTHTCNPSYLAGRTQKDWGSKHCQANTLADSISKIGNTKKWLSKWLKGACIVSMSTTTKKKIRARTLLYWEKFLQEALCI
jgi:hypothetical protein